MAGKISLLDTPSMRFYLNGPEGVTDEELEEIEEDMQRRSDEARRRISRDFEESLANRPNWWPMRQGLDGLSWVKPSLKY